ncbi:hypothetical protein KPL35_13825 [Clostridium sp. CF011]|uniref:hypothetical protein n=1 Tax=Clostridium sp. CF011 TaxID=2843318 RepID=UPI001C0BA7E6|nr:hypothetical protein [Clostridium sp. CF011]MBU3093149.1 hypothetical protein [Clostridium sp. CF011]WAG68470.1 hypothetical protein LL036_10165 [Clostridium sp. CF011]
MKNMKKLYVVEKVVTILTLSLLLIGAWLSYTNNVSGGVIILCVGVISSLLRNKFFKKIEYKNKKVDFIFEIIIKIYVLLLLIIGLKGCSR